MPGDLPQAPLASRIEEHLANFVSRPRRVNKEENATGLRYLSPEAHTKQLRGSEEWVQQLRRSIEEHQIAAPPWCLTSPQPDPLDPHQSREEVDLAETEEIAFNKKSVTDTPRRSEADLAARSSLRQDKMPAAAGHSAKESSAAKDTKDEDIFKQYDDGDGVLSREELKRMQAENSKLAEVDFDKLDTDGDGVVSKDELAAALDWDSMQDTKDQDIFKQYDDGDGVLSRDELKRMQAENSKLAEVDFDKLDTDGDGVISKDELAAALDWDSMQETKNEDSLQVAITVQSAAALSQQSRELLDSSRMASQRKEKRKAKRKEQAAAQAAQAQAVEATRLASGPLRASVDGQKIPAGGVPEGKETELPGDLLRDSKEDLADTERALTKREEPEDAISMAGGAQLVTSLNAQSTENELETSGKEVAGAEGHMLAAKRPSVSPEGSGQDRDMKPTMESGSRDPPQFPVEMAPFKEDPHQRQAQRQGLEPAQSSPDLPFETF